MNIATANHDLTGVQRLEIKGWPGAFRLQYNKPGPDVELRVPKRCTGESWTFGDTDGNGVLRVSSSLTGSRPDLLSKDDPSGCPWPPMIIKMPPDAERKVVIKFV